MQVLYTLFYLLLNFFTYRFFPVSVPYLSRIRPVIVQNTVSTRRRVRGKSHSRRRHLETISRQSRILMHLIYTMYISRDFKTYKKPNNLA